MARNYSNIALDTTLTAGIGAGDPTCVVTSAAGWPAAPFAAVLDPGLVTEEVVQVTVKVGATFTITRGFDGTTAAIHALGAVVRHSAIAGDFTDLQAADSTLQTNITSEATTRATADSTHAALTTTAHGGIVASTDPRLTDARTPTAHAATHASIGTDPVTLAQSQITGLAAALALLAPLASPTLTGIPAAPTAGLGTNTTQIATTAFVLANAGGGAGTVTSVALTVPGVLFSVAGSPVTTAGTLALSLLTQTANTVLAGPTSGGAATPTMRTLVQADLGTGSGGAGTKALYDDLTWKTVSAGGVSSVTASAPLASSGGATPDISLTGTVAAARGGTGVSNAGTLTNASNTTITGGGTLALAGFTLTVPATGSAALLEAANVFTQPQTINGANLGIAITGAASGGTPSIVASSPAVAASTAVGTPLQITASPAIAGSTNAGAAAGGDVTITAGAAARLTSGNADGGNINLVPGAGIGTGVAGQVLNPFGTVARPGIGLGVGATGYGFMLSSVIGVSFAGVMVMGFNGSALFLNTGVKLSWGAGAPTSTQDAAIVRSAAGIVEINNATIGQWAALKAGTRDAGTTTITDGMTLGHQSTGTPAAGLGIGIQLNINSSTTADQSAARLTAEWADATHATRKARVKLNVYDTATREGLRVEASGTAPLIGFLGAAAVGIQTLGAAATDAATTQTLANNLRTAMINLGLGQT